MSSSKEDFLNDLRRELIESGELSPMLVSFIQDYIEYEVDRKVSNQISNLAEDLGSMAS